MPGSRSAYWACYSPLGSTVLHHREIASVLRHACWPDHLSLARPNAASLLAAGKLLMVHTKLSGQYVLRFAIGTTGTQGRHVADAWLLIGEEAGRLLAEQEQGQGSEAEPEGDAAEGE